MIDARKIFLDVTFQDVGVDLSKLLEAVDRRMGPLVFAGRVRIVNESRVKEWSQNIVHRMVNDPIPVRCGADQTLLRFVDREVTIGSWFVPFLGQLFVKIPEFPLQREIETGCRTLKTLSSLS